MYQNISDINNTKKLKLYIYTYISLNDQIVKVEPEDLNPKPPRRPGHASAELANVVSVHSSVQLVQSKSKSLERYNWNWTNTIIIINRDVLKHSKEIVTGKSPKQTITHTYIYKTQQYMYSNSSTETGGTGHPSAPCCLSMRG